MSLPHIGVSHTEHLPHESLDEFANAIRHDGLDVKRESRPQDGPDAGLEWLVPTAIVVFITKAYFDAFLKEAGKDPYLLLKKALTKLTERWTGPAAPSAQLVFSNGKADSPIPK